MMTAAVSLTRTPDGATCCALCVCVLVYFSDSSVKRGVCVESCVSEDGTTPPHPTTGFWPHTNEPHRHTHRPVFSRRLVLYFRVGSGRRAPTALAPPTVSLNRNDGSDAWLDDHLVHAGAKVLRYAA